mmetsp:Transcript_79690/g.221753  ORF Transcript_79690/g.221753 Transcript_79690/m.221753 type:complete len:703 (+) Transcript_79690:386-2494(+)
MNEIRGESHTLLRLVHERPVPNCEGQLLPGRLDVDRLDLPVRLHAREADRRDPRNGTFELVQDGRNLVKPRFDHHGPFENLVDGLEDEPGKVFRHLADFARVHMLADQVLDLPLHLCDGADGGDTVANRHDSAFDDFPLKQPQIFQLLRQSALLVGTAQPVRLHLFLHDAQHYAVHILRPVARAKVHGLATPLVTTERRVVLQSIARAVELHRQLARITPLVAGSPDVGQLEASGEHLPRAVRRVRPLIPPLLGERILSDLHDPFFAGIHVGDSLVEWQFVLSEQIGHTDLKPEEPVVAQRFGLREHQEPSAYIVAHMVQVRRDRVGATAEVHVVRKVQAGHPNEILCHLQFELESWPFRLELVVALHGIVPREGQLLSLLGGKLVELLGGKGFGDYRVVLRWHVRDREVPLDDFLHALQHLPVYPPRRESKRVDDTRYASRAVGPQVRHRLVRCAKERHPMQQVSTFRVLTARAPRAGFNHHRLVLQRDRAHKILFGEIHHFLRRRPKHHVAERFLAIPQLIMLKCGDPDHPATSTKTTREGLHLGIAHFVVREQPILVYFENSAGHEHVKQGISDRHRLKLFVPTFVARLEPEQLRKHGPRRGICSFTARLPRMVFELTEAALALHRLANRNDGSHPRHRHALQDIHVLVVQTNALPLATAPCVDQVEQCLASDDAYQVGRQCGGHHELHAHLVAGFSLL